MFIADKRRFVTSFGIPWLGALIMTIVIYLTLLLDFNKIVSALGIVTPFLIIMVILAVYYLFAGSVPLNEVNSTVDKTSVFWGIVRGLMYGGLAFAVGFSTVVAIGGDASKRKISGGATFGGVIYTILLALINFALEYPKIKDVEIPTLTLANAIHPWIGLVLTVIMLTVMYNTILGLCYSFAARFTEPYSKNITSLSLL